MHPDVEPFAKDVAEKQKAFFDAWHQLQESNLKLMHADPSEMSYYAISDAHRRTFDKWIEAAHALEDAVIVMQERAMDAAGIPSDHPLREWLRSRKR
jgi:hypothetical protein